MNKAIIPISIVLVVLIIIFISQMDFSNKKESEWFERLSTKMEEPYDLKFAEELLKESTSSSFKRIGTNENLPSYLYDVSYEGFATYVFIGSDYYLNESDCQSLMDFVGKGNSVFISTNKLPDSGGNYSESFKELFNWIGIEEKQFSDSNIHVSVEGENENFHFVKHNPFSEENIGRVLRYDDYENKRTILGATQLGTNLLQIDHGYGKFIFHSSPILFTNYFLGQEQGFEYYQAVLNKVELKGTLLYDDVSRYRKDTTKQKKEFFPLQVIWGNRSLKLFFTIILVLVLVYVFVNSKRKQRIIPLMEPNSNTTIELSKAIGELYLKEGNNKMLSIKMIQMFKFHILNKYGVAWSNLEEGSIDKLSSRSGLKKSFWEMLSKDIEKFSSSEIISQSELIRLYNKLEIIYNKKM